jgi:hydrogenase expression/formation protein HypE
MPIDEGPLPVGKLNPALLAALLGDITCDDPGVILGPGIGRDVAVLDNGADGYLIAKTDPVTFATDAIGYYVVNVNANDIATSGGSPRWFLATALLPDTTATAAMAAEIFSQIDTACRKLNVTLVGGHTEITHDLNRPIVVGQMLGEVARDRLITPAGLRVGDAIILTKWAPVEGTALIAREQPEKLLGAGYTDETVRRCAAMLFDPGISVLRDAQVAVASGEVHAMHDPTEGGIATGLWEMAEAAGLGLSINRRSIPIAPEARDICLTFGLEPLGLIASGSLLIGCAPADAEAIVAALEEAGIVAAIIGRAVPASEGVTLTAGRETVEMPRFDQDELTRIL